MLDSIDVSYFYFYFRILHLTLNRLKLLLKVRNFEKINKIKMKE